MVRKLAKWRTTSLMSVSMGHEVGVTTLQLARACSVVANGGLLVKPRLILKKGNETVPVAPPHRILKPETAITMRQMMEGVVLCGTGRRYAKLEGYSSAGKTGSAQIYDFATRHYTHSYNASFMGFAPVTNPAIVVVVTRERNARRIRRLWRRRGRPGLSRGQLTEALRVLDVPKDLPDAAPDAEPNAGGRSGRCTHRGLDRAEPHILEEVRSAAMPGGSEARATVRRQPAAPIGKASWSEGAQLPGTVDAGGGRDGASARCCRWCSPAPALSAGRSRRPAPSCMAEKGFESILPDDAGRDTGGGPAESATRAAAFPNRTARAWTTIRGACNRASCSSLFPAAAPMAASSRAMRSDRGAVAVVSESPAPDGFTAPWIEVEHGRQALALAARNFYRQPG